MLPHYIMIWTEKEIKKFIEHYENISPNYPQQLKFYKKLWEEYVVRKRDL